jgi:crotonobetainyl-CoA:carnitine CoA-transferase CaiB-like acyl-CoA transferase
MIMAGYHLLEDVLVLEVSHYGPDALGGQLADLGATVIKIESPEEGDALRRSGAVAAAEPNGFGYLHLRWNRGKQSVALDLKATEGAAIFRDLAKKADVVIEGMRAGVLERLGLGFAGLRDANPALVFCSLSGLGTYGPYHRLGSHGPSFDALGGLTTLREQTDRPGVEFDPAQVSIGMYAMGLYGTIGVLAALHRARLTGEGEYVEVAAADCSAHWLPNGIDVALNPDVSHPRPGFSHDDGKMAHWPRLHPYRAEGGGAILLQALRPKSWERFCRVVDRPELLEAYEMCDDVRAADEAVYRALCELFETRSVGEWMQLFLQEDIPAVPVNDHDSLAQDPHFLGRDNVYSVESQGVELRLTGTPMRLGSHRFSPQLAPEHGAHTKSVLTEVLGLPEDEVAHLRHRAVIG